MVNGGQGRRQAIISTSTGFTQPGATVLKWHVPRNPLRSDSNSCQVKSVTICRERYADGVIYNGREAMNEVVCEVKNDEFDEDEENTGGQVDVRENTEENTGGQVDVRENTEENTGGQEYGREDTEENAGRQGDNDGSTIELSTTIAELQHNEQMIGLWHHNQQAMLGFEFYRN